MLSGRSSVTFSNGALRHQGIWSGRNFPTTPNLTRSPATPWNNEMFLLITRASSKHPSLHDVLHLCLIDLVQKLTRAQVTRIYLPIYDPERSINMLPAWYSMLKDHFIDSNIDIVLHDRVYVSIALVRTHHNHVKYKFD